MIINVHAGHNPDGNVACGAIGLLKESTENRVVTEKVISLLEARGHTVYDCTCDNGTSKKDVLKRIITKSNEHDVDLDVSIHFNAGAKKKVNGKTTGVEVFIFSEKSSAAPYARNVCNAISALGYTNRGVKVNPNLYVLKHSTAPAMLVECCFVDDPDDVAIYDAEKMAEAIVEGITGLKVFSSYTVKVQAGTPVYEDARFDSDIVMMLEKYNIYTIVEEKNGFGRLKSGAGWLNLNVVEKR